MDWYGHSFAFKIRVDVEHVESQRYIGDFRLEKVSMVNWLDTLDEMNVKLSFCVLGITGELYPDVISDVAARGHEVYGHGMYHEPGFQGRPYREQRHEMLRMKQSLEQAIGKPVRGVGIPHHGLADENTLRAAAEVGLEYAEGRIRAKGAVLPQWHKIEGTDLKILVPGDQGRGFTDECDRRPYWALKHEEAFNPPGALKKWKVGIDWAKQNGGMASLVIHPWMLMVNPGELKVAKEVIRYAVDQGAWMVTVEGLIGLAGK
jgi:peptidoglycan/xylan/chitin deacetylase (PgdA/CDA1 family)